MCATSLETTPSGDPQLRKKCLDDIYDRDDSFNPASLDLSCLKGTDTGPREPGGLTGSEKDFMSRYRRLSPGAGTKCKAEGESRLCAGAVRFGFKEAGGI